MEGCVGALVGEMSEERKALVRKVGKEGQRGEGARKGEREREVGGREGGRRKGERGEGGREKGSEGDQERGEGRRGSNYPKGGLHTDIFIPGVPEVGQPKEGYHSTG